MKLFYVRQNKPYSRKQWFDTAHQVSIYMLGRRLSEYSIFKSGKLIKDLEADITTMKQQLEMA